MRNLRVKATIYVVIDIFKFKNMWAALCAYRISGDANSKINPRQTLQSSSFNPTLCALFSFIYLFLHIYSRVGGLYNCLSMSLFPLDYCIGARQPGINTEARIKRRHSVKTGDYVGIGIKDTHRAILCDARPLPVLFNKNANNSDNADPYIRDRVLRSSRIFFFSIYLFYIKLETVNFFRKSLDNHIKYLHYYKDFIRTNRERKCKMMRWKTCIG